MSRELVLVGLAGGLGVSAFVAFRLSLRNEVEKTLNTEYRYDEMIATDPIYKLGSKFLNIPTARELSDSLVPVWSLVMPQQALEDVLAHGRASAYWPANRRESKAPKIVDNALFAVLERLYYAQTNRQVAQK